MSRLVIAVLLSFAVPVRAQTCADDPALAAAAGALLGGDHRPTPAELVQAARRAGSDAPTVEAVLLSEDATERRERALRRRAERFEAPLVCGEAHSEGHRLLLIAPRAGWLEVTAGGVVARLTEGWREPRLYVRDAEGTLWQTGVRSADPIAIPPRLATPVTVQLVAEGPGGPRPVAERVLGAGNEEADSEAAGREAAGGEAVVPDSDEPVARRLDRLRMGARVGELRVNRLLDEVAARHARRVCARRAARHVTDEGDPERRLAREGIRARHVGETVARAGNVSRAYAAMLGSPSHRSALVDRRFTDVGIGEVSGGDGGTCLVVLLAAWPRAVPWTGSSF